jgi:hypothetical protein
MLNYSISLKKFHVYTREFHQFLNALFDKGKCLCCCRYPASTFIRPSLFVHIQIYSEYEMKYTRRIRLVYRSVTYRIVKERGFKCLCSAMHYTARTGYNERVGGAVPLLTRIQGGRFG